MRACRLKLLGHRDIIFEAIFRAIGIENIAGITDRRLADPFLG